MTRLLNSHAIQFLQRTVSMNRINRVTIQVDGHQTSLKRAIQTFSENVGLRGRAQHGGGGVTIICEGLGAIFSALMAIYLLFSKTFQFFFAGSHVMQLLAYLNSDWPFHFRVTYGPHCKGAEFETFKNTSFHIFRPTARQLDLSGENEDGISQHSLR